MAGEFHARHGSLIFLSNENHNARRRNATTEFNNGLLFSKCALKDSEIYEVRIDRKIDNWSGSLAIGVTTSNPSFLEIPSSASGLKNGSWIMSGVSVLKDGASHKDNYGQDLDDLKEGDRVGVQRESNATLHFYVNGIDQGVAATSLPSTVFAVIDLYGKCVEISVYKPYLPAEGITGSRTQFSTASVSFHPHCGTLVSLSNNNRTAERQRPTEEFKNAVVLSSVPLKNDELFEIRLEASTEMWAGSLEVGITGHDPETIVLPPTMTSMPTETWMLSGTSIIVNGQEIRKNYSEFSLETIQDGDRIGIMRKSSNCLHFFINGEDQGVAVSDIPENVFGVVDLYGAAVKVSLICENLSSCSVRANEMINSESQETLFSEVPEQLLAFHPRCGMAVSLLNENRTAFRPHAMEEFNNAVVITNRLLKPNELFEVHIDKQVEKWAGSLEIGVTTHSPEDLELPSTMTNITTGTWMMSGGGVVNNGVTTIEDYGHSLEELKVGDKVAALVKPDGSLHFFVNGRDLGLAAQEVPLTVYGVVDLYGQSAQATLTCSQRNHPDSQCETREEQASSGTCDSVGSTTPPQVDNFAASENWFRFSDRHGEQVTVSRDLRSAVRINPLTEFNNAVVMSHRPLRDDELFEIIVEKVVHRWSGSLEAGVTRISPEQLDFPGTMTDLGHDIWMLSGSSVLQDGNTVKNGYECDLDKLTEGSRLGMMRKSDGTLHFFVDGEDCGAAANSVPSGVYAMLDLYGQCVQISVYDEDYRGAQLIALPSEGTTSTALEQQQSVEVLPSRFHSCCGKNVTLRNNKMAAMRTNAFNNGLTFSSKPLQDDEIFEIKLDKVSNHWSGSIAVGVTSATLPLLTVPCTAAEMKDGTWIMSGSCVIKDAVVVKENYGCCLDRLQAGTCIGVQRRRDGTLHILINCVDQGVAATDVPLVVHAVVDIYGKTEAVSLVTETGTPTRSSREESLQRTPNADPSSPCPRISFHEISGQHIKLDAKCCTAERVDGYNHGVVMSNAPLPSDQLFQVEIKRVNSRWSGSVKIGVAGESPEDFTRMPNTANNIKSSSWIVLNNAVYVNGLKVSESLGRNLDILQAGDRVGVLVDSNGCLHLVINGEDLGAVAENIPSRRFAVVDLYGCCEEVTIVSDQSGPWRGSASLEGTKAALGLGEHAKGPCDYRQLCDRFRSSLAIPDGYFNPDSKLNICYCQVCHEARGEKRYSVSGDPPCRYGLPLGWCQFALRLPPKSEACDTWEMWHVAFYGCRAGWVRRILDQGYLPIAASQTSIQPSTSCNSNKEHETSSKLTVSPTILCATCNPLIIRNRFEDVTIGKQFSTQVAFQLRVRPGCYDTGQASCYVDRNALMDQNLGTENVEWYLKDRAVVVLTALLIRVDPS